MTLVEYVVSLMLLPHLERVGDNNCFIEPLGEIYVVLYKWLSKHNPGECSLIEAHWSK